MTFGPLTLRIVILAAVLGAGYIGWRELFPDDASQIRAALDRIAETVGAGDGQGDIVRLGRLTALRNELAPDVRVDAGPPFGDLTGRDAVVAAAARFQTMARDARVRFLDVEVHVAPDGTAATVSLTATADFADHAGANYDARELAIAFVRRDGRWLVQSVSLVRALRPAGRRASPDSGLYWT